MDDRTFDEITFGKPVIKISKETAKELESMYKKGGVINEEIAFKTLNEESIHQLTFRPEEPEYELNYDAIQTIEDVKEVFKLMNLRPRPGATFNAKYFKEVGADE